MSGTDRDKSSMQPTMVGRDHAVPVVDVQLLLKGSGEVRLLHQGTEYRLRVTKQGKLLLTK